MRCDGFAQLQQAKIGGVAGLALFKGVNGRFADVPRSDKIRLSNAERDDILHALNQLEKIANARARNLLHVRGHELFRLERLGHLRFRIYGLRPVCASECSANTFSPRITRCADLEENLSVLSAVKKSKSLSGGF